MSAPSTAKRKGEFQENGEKTEEDEASKLSTTISMLSNKIESLLNEEPDQWILDIDLGGKSLNSIPNFLPKYQFCMYLNLSGNNLNGNIDWLIHLKRLKVLDLSHNKLEELADVCGSVSTLEELNISHNLLKELPEWILLLESVRSLDLSHNPLQKTCHIHLNKAKWGNIEVCHLENLNLVSIPNCLLTAKKLKCLFLGTAINNSLKSYLYQNNVIWCIPEQLPPSLSLLDLSYVSLTNLEYDWKRLINLKEFRARGNDLFWPSEEFSHLKNLEICDMSSCKIFLLPKNFGCLNNLSVVNLSFNRFTIVPTSFELLVNLVHLDLYCSGVEIVNCKLDKLPRLLKCDLWMNVVDPLEILPNHTELCMNLREHLLPKEREERTSDRVVQSINSDNDNELSNESYNLSYGCFSKDRDFSSGNESEETDSDVENHEFDEANVSNLNEITSSTVTECEESWDDKVFSDQEFDETDLISQANMASKCINREGHFFLPSQLHATSCSLPPNQFRIIQGQFDDVD